MKMMRLSMIMAAFFIMASLVYADPPDFSKGKGAVGKGVGKNSPTGRVANEAADAVADVLTGTDNLPPGQGTMPPGLAKQGKTPPGWDKGNKVGWDKTTTDSPIKRWVKRWIFQQRDGE